MKNYKALSIISSVGVLVSSYFSFRNADSMKSSFRRAKTNEFKNREKNLEFIKASAPAVVSIAVTIGCIALQTKMTSKEIASVMAAGGTTAKLFGKYRNKVRELYGKETDQKIMAEIAKDDWGCSPALPTDSDASKKLFYDAFGDRYFYASTDRVMEAMYHVNRNLQLRGDAYLNEFYDFIGIEPDKKVDHLMWDVTYFIEGLGVTPWIDFVCKDLKLDNGKKAIMIDFEWAPEDCENLLENMDYEFAK